MTNDQNLIPASGQTALSHPINVLTLSPKGLTVKINATPEQRSQLAPQIAIQSVEMLEAVLLVKKWHKDGVRVSGPLKAKVVQECVVTLEPVEEIIDSEINAVFIPSTSKLAKPATTGEAGEVLIDPEGDDLPELFEPPFLDIGDIVSEFLVLALDPYPKAPGTDDLKSQSGIKSEEEVANNEDDSAVNPFAALAKIRDKL